MAAAWRLLRTCASVALPCMISAIADLHSSAARHPRVRAEQRSEQRVFYSRVRLPPEAIFLTHSRTASLPKFIWGGPFAFFAGGGIVLLVLVLF